VDEARVEEQELTVSSCVHQELSAGDFAEFVERFERLRRRGRWRSYRVDRDLDRLSANGGCGEADDRKRPAEHVGAIHTLPSGGNVVYLRAAILDRAAVDTVALRG